MSNTLSALKETKTVYQSRARGFTPGFLWVSVSDLFVIEELQESRKGKDI
jgi:hypothetical protein